MAVACCLGISALYVASLYIWRVPADRQHPTTVRARMVGVLLTCCVAWLPAWHIHHNTQSEQDLPDLLQLLGLHLSTRQLLPALAKAAGLTLVLFLGPLHHQATQQYPVWRKPSLGRVSWLHAARDLVVSPVSEEWCFRACMVPCLWMQVS